MVVKKSCGWSVVLGVVTQERTFRLVAVSEGAPTAPSDPVVGRATHAADLDLDTPTPLMLSCLETHRFRDGLHRLLYRRTHWTPVRMVAALMPRLSPAVPAFEMW